MASPLVQRGRRSELAEKCHPMDPSALQPQAGSGERPELSVKPAAGQVLTGSPSVLTTTRARRPDKVVCPPSRIGTEATGRVGPSAVPVLPDKQPASATPPRATAVIAA